MTVTPPLEGYLYAVVVREFLNENPPVVEIGYTKNYHVRYKQYPKGSKTLLLAGVPISCKIIFRVD
jgi:hypothetical protein